MAFWFLQDKYSLTLKAIHSRNPITFPTFCPAFRIHKNVQFSKQVWKSDFIGLWATCNALSYFVL